MKKILLTISFLAVIVSTTIAHTISVGYVLHQEGSDSKLTTNGKTACSAAILLDSDKLAQYGGNGIRSVRVSLPNTKVFVDSVVVWERNSIDGENLAMGKITRFKDDGFDNISKGWNEVELDKEVALTADSRLYVGYTYYQRTSVCGTRLIDDINKGISFIKLGSDAEWTEIDNGTLAIEAGIDGNKMPKYDISLLSARGLILGDGTRQIEAHLYNRGQEEVRTIDISLEGNGYDGTYKTETSILPDRLDTLTFNIDNAEDINPGNILSMTIKKINDYEDEFDADNKATCLFNKLRIVLVEEFTTEQCPNCPRAAEYLHEILNGGSDVARNMAVVCHHAGYHTDDFTSTADVEYTWFYNNNGGTFAPALMYNRLPLGMADGGATPVIGVVDKEQIEACVNSIAEEESVIVITANAKYADNGKSITVEVKGKRIGDYPEENKRMTVFLTEDNVFTNKQAGSGTDTYYHQHVMRAINATWGEAMTWNGDDFEYTCKFDIDNSWKKENLKIIASVGNYDSSNPANSVIENTAVTVPDNATGIKETLSEKSMKEAKTYYSIDGRQLSSISKGITIVRYKDGSVRKVLHP